MPLLPEGPNPIPFPRTIRLTQNVPYVWLVALDIPSPTPTKLRMAAYPEAVTFERNSAGTVITYLPFAFSITPVQTDTEGALPAVTLEIQNVTQEGEALYRQYNGLEGQKVRVILVRLSETPDGSPLIDELFVVDSSGSKAGTVALSLSKRVLQRTGFPNRRVSRTFCAHVYGSPLCGYDTSRVGALQTCSKNYDGTNGCVEHGDDEEAAGLPRRHPNRFLGFRGIARKTGIGVSR